MHTSFFVFNSSQLSVIELSMKKIIELNFKLEEMYEQFYPKLEEQVFHYTSGINLNSILEQGSILPDKEGVRKTSAHSHESMGHFLKAVCLFDLRSKPIDQIEKIRGWYNFLEPRLDENILVYLIMSDNYYKDLTVLSDLNEETKKIAMYLPHIESWHKGAIPMDKIEMIYKVKIQSI